MSEPKLSREDLAALKELAGKASKGLDRHGEPVASCWEESPMPAENQANAAFIAASREAVPALIEMVEGLTKERDEAFALTTMGLTVGGGLMVYGSAEAIGRVQNFILIDSSHPVEKEDVRRSLARDLQAAERRAGELEAEIARLTPYVEAFRREEARADRLDERCEGYKGQVKAGADLIALADAIRTAQRAYMADRGNEEKGKAVAEAAAAYDRAREHSSMTADIVERLRHLVSLNEVEKGGPYGGYAAQMCVEAMREAASLIEAKVPEGVRVKALEWADDRAGCSLGLYHIVHLDGRFYVRLNYNTIEFCATEAEAKAAAQADYEKRIRSALEPAAPHRFKSDGNADNCRICGKFPDEHAEWEPAAPSAISASTETSALPDTCCDCRQPFGPTEGRYYLGSVAYHNNCGPASPAPASGEKTEDRCPSCNSPSPGVRWSLPNSRVCASSFHSQEVHPETDKALASPPVGKPIGYSNRSALRRLAEMDGEIGILASRERSDEYDLPLFTAPVPAPSGGMVEALNALRAIAYMECLTREGEEPPHLLMMKLAQEALAKIDTALAAHDAGGR